MDKIIPDDILNDSFDINTIITFKNERLSFTIHAQFCSVDGVAYDVTVEHRDDTSVMKCTEGEVAKQYYFSPYTTQKYIRLIMAEFSKGKPSIDCKYELLMLINKIKQKNLKEVELNGESEQQTD